MDIKWSMVDNAMFMKLERGHGYVVVVILCFKQILFL